MWLYYYYLLIFYSNIETNEIPGKVQDFATFYLLGGAYYEEDTSVSSELPAQG